jgi:vacuolar-type H+-ATPase subunit I/STV1
MSKLSAVLEELEKLGAVGEDQGQDEPRRVAEEEDEPVESSSVNEEKLIQFLDGGIERLEQLDQSVAALLKEFKDLKESLVRAPQETDEEESEESEEDDEGEGEEKAEEPGSDLGVDVEFEESKETGDQKKDLPVGDVFPVDLQGEVGTSGGIVIEVPPAVPLPEE